MTVLIAICVKAITGHRVGLSVVLTKFVAHYFENIQVYSTSTTIQIDTDKILRFLSEEENV